MKKFPPKFKFYLVAYVIPLLLVLVWAGKDIVVLVKNKLKLRSMKAEIVRLTQEKEKLAQNLKGLENNDQAAWESQLRKSRALKPNEVEYRFK